jgi:hypothetical protein
MSSSAPAIERLRFGDAEHIRLVDSAMFLLNEYDGLTGARRTVRSRVWWRRGPKCALCRAALQRDELLVEIGRRAFHDACLVARLVELRMKLRALGYTGLDGKVGA